MAERYDVIVIGNGAVGLSIAHRLKARAPELRVLVIGKQARPGGATPAAGAMLNAWGDLVRDQFSWPALAQRAELMIGALPLWDGFCEALAPYAAAPLIPGWGTLILETGRGGASEIETLTTVVAALEARGLSAPRHAQGRFIPDGWLDAVAFLDALERAVCAQGVDFVDGAVAALNAATTGWSVSVGGEAVQGEQVVLANGPFAQVLVDGLEAVRRAAPRLLYEAGAGFIVTVHSSAPILPYVVRTLGRGAIGGFHIVPLGGARYYVGATAEAAAEPNWEFPERRLAVVRRAFIEEYDPIFASANFTHGALGFRALSADGFPMLGQSHERGLWFATGMRRDGLTSAPAIARDIADAMLDGNVSTTLDTFRPSRDLLSYKAKPQALADAASGHSAEEKARLAALYDLLDVGAFGVAPGVLPLLGDANVRALLAHPRSSGAD